VADYLKTDILPMPVVKGEILKKKQPILTFLNGQQVGRHILLAHDTIILGRSPEVTIMIEDNRVSREHVSIVFDRASGEYMIVELGSSNGTYINGRKISRQVLNQEDKIFLGDTILRFSRVDSLDMEFHGELERLINIDELTGLLVKRRFNEETSRLIAVSLKDNSPFCMLVMDMDGVKSINDTHGHHFGAYSIAETGKIIKRSINERGLASRFGGDEFIACLLNTSSAGGRRAGEKIRKAVEQHPYILENIEVHPTISIGVASLKTNDTLETLFKRADAALYRAKNGGRNMVCL